MTQARWEQFQEILSELKVKPVCNIIHAGDVNKPIGTVVRVSMDVKFRVDNDEKPEVVEPEFLRKRGRPSKNSR